MKIEKKDYMFAVSKEKTAPGSMVSFEYYYGTLSGAVREAVKRAKDKYLWKKGEGPEIIVQSNHGHTLYREIL
jgi:hypothetical protein